MKYTNEQYLKLIATRNPTIKPLETYRGMFTPIKHSCLICGYGSKGEWSVIPSNLVKTKKSTRRGCPKCGYRSSSKKKMKGNKYYLDKVYNLVGNEYTIHSAEINTKHKITITHNKCLDGGHYTYCVYIQKFTSGRRCPRCAKILRALHRKYSNKEVDKIMLSVLGKDYHRVSNYVDSETKMKIYHSKCKNNIYLSLRQIVDRHTGCYICSGNSRGESLIAEILTRLNIPYEYQKCFSDCKDKNLLPFDFYLPTYNLIIEYDGIQHHDKTSLYYSDTEVKHDRIKNKYCQDKGIKLYRMSYKYNTYDSISVLINKLLNSSSPNRG